MERLFSQNVTVRSPCQFKPKGYSSEALPFKESIQFWPPTDNARSHALDRILVEDIGKDGPDDDEPGLDEPESDDDDENHEEAEDASPY